MEIIKVSSHSVPRMVAGAIAGAVRKAGQVSVQSVGAGATNQAAKAIAIAAKFIAEDAQNVEGENTGRQLDLVCKPGFTTAIIEGNEKTAMEFIVYAINLVGDAE